MRRSARPSASRWRCRVAGSAGSPTRRATELDRLAGAGRRRRSGRGLGRTHVGEFVTLQVQDAVGTIRLERPPMNALDAQMQEELYDAATRASASPDVRAVVVYGGPKVFAAGADIKEMAGMSYADMTARAHRLSTC